MSWLRLILISLTSLMLLLLVMLGLLLFTPAGNQLIWQQAKQTLPELKGDLLAGHLGVGWQLRGLSWHSTLIDIEAESVSLRWQLGGLLSGRLPIEQLAVDKARIRLHPIADANHTGEETVESSDDATPLRLNLPLELVIADLQLHDVQFDSQYIQVVTQQLAASGRWHGERFDIHNVLVSDVDVALPDAMLESEPSGGESAEEKARSVPLKAPFDEQEIRKRIAVLSEVILPFDLYVDQLQARQIRYHQRGFDTQRLDFELAGSFVGSLIQISSLQLRHPWGDLVLDGEIGLHDYYPMSVQIRGVERLPQLPPALFGRQLDLRVNGSLTDLKSQLRLSGSEKLTLSARLNTLAPDLPFELQGEWQALRWPLQGEAEYQAGKGQLIASGRLNEYRLNLNSRVQLSSLPKGQLAVELDGSLDAIAIKQLKIEAGDSALATQGQLSWTHGLHWQGKSQLISTNLHALLPDISGRVSAELDSLFTFQGNKWELKLDRMSAHGQLNGYPLSMQGKLSGNQLLHWRFENIQLTSGQNRLLLDGVLSDRWQAKASLQAGDLKQLDPELTGSVSAKLQLSGDRHAPEIALSMTSDEIRLPGLRLRQLAVDGYLKMAAVWSGRLQANMARLRSGAMRLDGVDLHLDGDEQAHQLQLSFEGQPLSSQLQLEGSWGKTGWQGKLLQAHVKTPIADWVLQSPLMMTLNRTLTTLGLSEQCWLADQQGMLCASAASLSQAQGELAVTLKAFPTQKLAPFMPERLEWLSEINADGKFGWSKQQPTAELTITAAPGKLIADRLETQYDVLQVNAKLEAQLAQVALRFASNQLGKADVALQVSDPMSERKLSGNVDISGLRLYGLAPLLDELKRTKGRIDAHGRMDGTLDKPLFFGRVTLDEGEIETSSDIAVIRQLHSELDIRGSRADLSGRLMVGKGSMELGGFADWSSQPLTGRLTIHADTLEVGLAGYGRARVSSDLAMALGEELRLEGRVQIPWARIKVKSVPDSAVNVSEDVQIITQRRKKAAPAVKPLPMHIDLTVGLGGDVQLDALGLKTKLLGGIRLTQSPENAFRADGEITLDDGRFKSFGQNLLIDEGKLRFSGNISAPYLAVKAYRDPDTMEDSNVTVGVKVSGPATQPKIEIYSEPQLSETEKLSYLLRGKSTSSSGSTSNDEAMTGILLGAGLSQANGVVSDIAETFGFSDVSLDSSGSGDETQVSISGYLMPGLQLQYGMGVFTSISEVRLRYELMPRLYVQVMSGLNQALDLFYKFEF